MVCFGCAPPVMLAPSLNLVGHFPRACAICAHPARLRPAAHLSPRVVMPSLCDSTGREGVRSVAELRYFQGHDHEKHVCGAPRACPGPQPLVRFSPCACAAWAAAPHPPVYQPAHLAPHRVCPPIDSAGGECVQSAAELRHVQGHEHEGRVCGALRACLGPQPL